MSADAVRSIKLDSMRRNGLLLTVLVAPLVGGVGRLTYLQITGGLSASSAWWLGGVCALASIGVIVIAITNASARLVIDAERVTLEGWRGKTVAQTSRAKALATPGVFFYSAFWSDSVIESDSPMLTLGLEGHVITIMLSGGVSGWPREPIVKRRPRYRVNKEDFRWLAESLCTPAAIAEVDFTD